jgi:predicted nucleic acid-binding protein
VRSPVAGALVELGAAEWSVDTDRARDLVSELPALSVRDAVHAAVMLNHGIARIATFDRGFDLVPGIERLKLDSTTR